VKFADFLDKLKSTKEGDGTCPSCGANPNSGAESGQSPAWIYALGRAEFRFPRISVEKEFAQVLGRDKASGLTDGQALHEVLSKRENRYLVRQMCWVMTI
jgi:hypothetical protein